MCSTCAFKSIPVSGPEFERRFHSLSILHRAYTCQGMYRQGRAQATVSVGVCKLHLDQLSEQLLTVVQETVQPSHLSLWLRPRKPQEEPGKSETRLPGS